MTENEIASKILNLSFAIHTKLGPGLLESVYEKILEYELINEAGFSVKCQSPILVVWKDIRLELGFRADIIVENKVLIELKSIEKIAPVHPKQVLTHLRLTDLKLGLLINFNERYLKNGIQRIVNNL